MNPQNSKLVTHRVKKKTTFTSSSHRPASLLPQMGLFVSVMSFCLIQFRTDKAQTSFYPIFLDKYFFSHFFPGKTPGVFLKSLYFSSISSKRLHKNEKLIQFSSTACEILTFHHGPLPLIQTHNIYPTLWQV